MLQEHSSLVVPQAPPAGTRAQARAAKRFENGSNHRQDMGGTAALRIKDCFVEKMDAGDGNRFWELGDRLHVNCPRSKYFRRFAVVTRVESTRLLVAFDDGNQSDFVDLGRVVSHAPPLRVRHRSSLYPQVQREGNVGVQAVMNDLRPEPVPRAEQPGTGRGIAALHESDTRSVEITGPVPDTQTGLVRIVVRNHTPQGNAMRVVIDSLDTPDHNDGPSEVTKTLERLAYTVADVISSNSDNTEHNARVVNDFDRIVRGNVWLRSGTPQNGGRGPSGWRRYNVRP
jgi:hypothetical protein